MAKQRKGEMSDQGWVDAQEKKIPLKYRQAAFDYSMERFEVSQGEREPSLRMIFVNSLRSERDQAGWTRKTLAERCGMSSRRVRMIEREWVEPSAAEMTRIATALGKPILAMLQPDGMLAPGSDASNKPHLLDVRHAFSDAIERLLLNELENATGRAAITMNLTHHPDTNPNEKLDCARKLARLLHERGDSVWLFPQWEDGSLHWHGIAITALSLRQLNRLWSRKIATALQDAQHFEFLANQPITQQNKWYARPRRGLDPEAILNLSYRYSPNTFELDRDSWVKYALRKYNFPLERSAVAGGALAEAWSATGCGFADDSLTEIIRQMERRPDALAVLRDYQDRKKGRGKYRAPRPFGFHDIFLEQRNAQGLYE